MTNEGSREQQAGFEQKVEKINKLLQKWLLSGKLIFDQASGYRISKTDDGFLVETDSYSTLEQKYLGIFNSREHVEGSCQVINPVVAGKLKELGLVDDVEYFIDDEVHHTAIIATIEGRRVFIDLGRYKPIAVVIPLNNEVVESDFYTDQRPIKRHAYEDERGVHLVIRDPYGLDEGVEPEDRQLNYRKIKTEEEPQIPGRALRHYDHLVRPH